jgi:hypothetical protein
VKSIATCFMFLIACGGGNSTNDIDSASSDSVASDSASSPSLDASKESATKTLDASSSSVSDSSLGLDSDLADAVMPKNWGLCCLYPARTCDINFSIFTCESDTNCSVGDKCTSGNNCVGRIVECCYNDCTDGQPTELWGDY